MRVVKCACGGVAAVICPEAFVSELKVPSFTRWLKEMSFVFVTNFDQ
jgi:hypothetical protein